jgi:hypothetical protein
MNVGQTIDPDVRTMRDYFAAAALTGLLAAEGSNPVTYAKSAEMAFKQADAMLAARKEQPK